MIKANSSQLSDSSCGVRIFAVSTWNSVEQRIRIKVGTFYLCCRGYRWQRVFTITLVKDFLGFLSLLWLPECCPVPQMVFCMCVCVCQGLCVICVLTMITRVLPSSADDTLYVCMCMYVCVCVCVFVFAGLWLCVLRLFPHISLSTYHICRWWTDPWCNIKMSSYQYRRSHSGDGAVVRSSYTHN